MVGDGCSFFSNIIILCLDLWGHKPQDEDFEAVNLKCFRISFGLSPSIFAVTILFLLMLDFFVQLDGSGEPKP